MKKIINDIISYIEFLRKNDIKISLSIVDDKFRQCYISLYEYESHCVPVCAFMKRKNFLGCTRNKLALLKSGNTTSFYGYCRAGVEEYVIPLLIDEKPLLYVNISGFCGKLEGSDKKRAKASNRYGTQFDKLFSQLDNNVPALDDVMPYVNPLLHMLQKAYEETDTEQPANVIYANCIKFIYNNFTDDIKCSDVAKYVNYSESYVRHVFKENSNMGIAEFILKVRITKACELLKQGNMTVAQVATNVGFNDPNYFSVKFKEYTKISPQKYKKSNF